MYCLPPEHVLSAQPQQLREPFLSLFHLLVGRVPVLTSRDRVLVLAVESICFPEQTRHGQVDKGEESAGSGQGAVWLSDHH